MAKVKLHCGVYGKGGVFSIEIERNADVEALQKAIFDGQRYHERFSFPPNELTLYLARKKGETTWMKQDRNTEIFLRGGIATDYEKMLSLCTLDEEEYFGVNYQPGRKEIHVLVELPPDQAGVKMAGQPSG